MKKLLMACCLLLSVNASALELAGVNLSDTVQVGTQTLVLNGAGIRTKWFFKIYIGALYLTKKQSSAEAIIADESGHRVALHMLHELSGTKLYGAFSEAVEANHTAAEIAALDEQMKQMRQIFNLVDEVKPGDVITLDYLQSSGTQIVVNGTVRGTIAGTAFNRALLKIWLGSKPVQGDLKQAMLGAS